MNHSTTNAGPARAARAIALLTAAAVCGGVAHGQDVTRPDEAQSLAAASVDDMLEDVGIEQHLEAMLPLDAEFVDSTGRATTFGSYFDGEHPVLLTLNYVDCPQLCSMQLSALTEAMAAVDLELGRDYRVVTVSIDPRDTPEKAAGAEARYVADYRFSSDKAGTARSDAAAAGTGWTYLVGEKLDIDRVAAAAGFRYRWIESQGEYAHAAATILCSPNGQITRYLPGLGLGDAGTLKMALVEAGEGKIGTLFENAFLNCLIFDPTKGQYTPNAILLLKVAAALMAFAIAGSVFFMRRGEAQRGRQATLAAAAAEGATNH